MNIFSRNEWLRLSDSILADISELNDNKFAVINGTHIDYTVYRCVKLTVSVITLYEADECYNMSEAGAEYMKEEFIKVVYVFFGEEEEDKATSYFVSLINDLLYGNNISNYNIWSQIRENERQNEKRERKMQMKQSLSDATAQKRR
jgi:hypothetical protein